MFAAAIPTVRRVRSPIVESLEQRVAAEFAEMPGMSLTEAQARRLFNIPQPTCAKVLDTLVRCGVLRRCADGQYRSRAIAC